MKKKIVMKLTYACAALLVMGSLAGCENNKTTESQESQSQVAESTASGTDVAQNETEDVTRILLKDMDPSQYVKLGDYKSLRVTKDETTVSEDEVQEEMWNEYVAGFPEELGVKDRAGALGDAVNIDFEGKKDGVAFDGGTSQGYNLTLGSGSFIDGFEDGLVGVMPGETVDLNLKFPELYGNAELAGQEVVFTVTVNYVIPAEMMDEAIGKLAIVGVTNEAELRQYVYDEIAEYYEQQNAAEYEDKILQAFMDTCEFQELPESYVDNTGARVRQYILDTASQYGMDGDTFTAYVYGTDLNTFVDYYAKNTAQQNFALYLVAKEEGLILEDSEISDIALGYAANYGFTDLDSYFTAIDATLEEFREDYAVSTAYDRLLEIAQQ